MELRRLFTEHCARPFPPRCRGLEDPVDFVSLDTFTAGCVGTFLENEGTLDPGRTATLTKCNLELAGVARSLQGEEREYFQKLADLAGGSLEFLRAHAAGN